MRYFILSTFAHQGATEVGEEISHIQLFQKFLRDDHNHPGFFILQQYAVTETK